jgi:hypothetical protein
VSVVFKRNGSELVRGGHVIAKHGCWSLLKGGIVANFSSPAEILFEVKWFSSYLVLYITVDICYTLLTKIYVSMQSENPTVELWVDSVSLQPFTRKQWRSHQDNSIERVS